MMRSNLSVVARRSEPADSLDYFPTPPWATRAFVDRMEGHKLSAGDTILEPACGEGHMAATLAERHSVIARDIFDYGYGEVTNFLDNYQQESDWVFTNPPFNQAEAFARHGINVTRRGVALLVRLSWLESEKRYRLFKEFSPSLVLIYSGRVPMHKGRWEPAGSTATAYCWVVWERDQSTTQIDWIRPDAKRVYSRPDDAARFGAKTDAPLLGVVP